MKSSKAVRVPILGLAVLLVLYALPVAAGAGRTRPGGSGSSAPTRVTGTARYGYGHHARHQGQHYGGHYRYGGYYGYGYGSWGWPYGYYGYYRPYYGPYAYRSVGDTELPGAVETDVRPKKSRILVDGQPVGQARDYNGSWDLLFLEPGEHVVTFEAPGHMTLRLSMNVKPGSYQRVDHRLQKGEGIDPRSAELTATSSPQARPDPAVEEPTGLRTGLLSLRVLPPDAAVYLDGEFLARADELRRLHGAIPMAQGRHTIEAVRPGFESERRTVVIEGGEPVRVELKLERTP